MSWSWSWHSGSGSWSDLADAILLVRDEANATWKFLWTCILVTWINDDVSCTVSTALVLGSKIGITLRWALWRALWSALWSDLADAILLARDEANAMWKLWWTSKFVRFFNDDVRF